MDECCNTIREERPMQEQKIQVQPMQSKGRVIIIEPLNYGYNVKMDCHAFAVEGKERLIEKISAYIRNPEKVEKDWFSKGII